MNDHERKNRLRKDRDKKYREIAAKQHGVREHAFGAVTQMEDGAFVEIVVWVPLTEVEEAETNLQSVANDGVSGTLTDEDIPF